MCAVRISTRPSRHAQLLLLYTHPGAGMSLPLASCCSCCINQSNLHANKRKGCGLPNQLKTQLLPTCQIFRDREIPDIPEVAPKYRVMTQDPVHANDHRLAPIPAPLCFGQEAQADWHTRLNYELISLLSQYNLSWTKWEAHTSLHPSQMRRSVRGTIGDCRVHPPGDWGRYR